MSKPIACVTGASGMIGSKICKLLIARGCHVRALSRRKEWALENVEVINGDVEDADVLAHFMRDAQLFFHCAAELKDESKMWDINVLATKCILEISKSAGIKYFCYLSSVGVIGRTHLKVADELTSCDPQNMYEKSKWAAEQCVAGGIQGCKTVILRPTNVVDERKPGILALPQRGSWMDFCKVFLTGGESAHIVHADDVAEAAVHFISASSEDVQCYIVSCDEESLNTPAGLWALFNAYCKGGAVDAIRPAPHLPLLVPYLLRKILRGYGNMGDVRYSSGKLMRTGFVFKLGLQGAVRRIAISSGARCV